MSDKPKLPADFLQMLRDLEESYLAETDPIRQSGFGGGPDRWRGERGIILEAIDGDGDFLDTGCANGYLLQCLVEWARDRGITLIPCGLDQGARLVGLARQRLPQRADHFWVGNAWDWSPSRRFRYVYTLTDYVPKPFLREYLVRVMRDFVEEDGRLIVGAYGSMSRGEPAQDVTRLLSGFGFPIAGTATHGALPVVHIAWTEAGQFARAYAS
jgi:hypothetical protein